MEYGKQIWTRTQAVAAATGNGNSGTLSTKNIRTAALDINVAVITGGTTPDITFFVDRLGGDGIWYAGAQSAALTAVGPVSIDIAPDLPDAADTQHMVFTDSCRVRWVFAGAVVADSIKFSASLYGRP